jgi:glycosyltransferase involved in cell wall biosynthesis
MCTYNGAAFIGEQLQSIQSQCYQNWKLLVADDGSTDGTLQILSQFQASLGDHRIKIRDAPRKGFIHNYLQQTCDATVEGDFFAWCDQDDIWEADKLQRAVTSLRQVPPAVPALYCSRTKHIAASGSELGYSRLFTGQPVFANALVQSIAGGNTMVFNRAARRLIQQVGLVDAPAHDWLLYLLVTAADGTVNYDPYPSVRYRLHPGNVIGNPGWFRRLDMLLNDRFRLMTDKNLAILRSVRPMMSARNRIVYDEFSKLRQCSFLGRMYAFSQTGIHRKSLVGNLGLWLAIILGKL